MLIFSLICLHQVCKRMDMICQRVLNQGFLKVERYHSLCQRQVKAQLPRSVWHQHGTADEGGGGSLLPSSDSEHLDPAGQ